MSGVNSQEVAVALWDVGALTVDPKQPVRYKSGLFGPVYIDNRRLTSHPSEWSMVVGCLVDAIKPQVLSGKIQKLIGAPTAGISHATLVSAKLGLPMVELDYQRSHPLTGELPMVCGRLNPADKFCVIEDHTSTGSSALAVVQDLRARQAVVDWCIAITTQDLKRVQEVFLQNGVNFQALCTIQEILEVARPRGLSTAHYQVAKDWLANPPDWSRRYLASLN